MATLKEYFEADFSHTVIMSSPIQLSISGVGDIQIEEEKMGTDLIKWPSSKSRET